jgi:hypothetical protein
MKRLRRYIVLFLALSIGIGGCCTLPLYWLQHLRMQDDPARVYRYYERELRRYAERLEAGEVYSEPNRGYTIPQFLVNHGATYVVKKGECFIVRFEVMATDPVPELWYSSKGFEPLPEGLKQLKHENHYFRWEQLSPNWGACYWDP